MKKRVTPQGYQVVDTGKVQVGDMIWDKRLEMYCPISADPHISVEGLVSVVRPIESDQYQILGHLRALMQLVPQLKIRVPNPHVNGDSNIIVEGQCGRIIANLEFHRGGKLKKADTQ
jgi:hypothetical protein